MHKKILFGAIAQALFVVSIPIYSTYSESPETVTGVFLLIAMLVAIGLAPVIYLFELAVFKAVSKGPNATPLKWYQSPVIWILPLTIGIIVFMLFF